MIRAFTLKSAERQVDPEAKVGNKRSSSSSTLKVVPVLWIVLGIASILVFISILLGFVIRTRCFTGGGGGSSSGGRGGAISLRGGKAAAAGEKKSKKKKTTMHFPHHHQPQNEMEINPDLIPRNGKNQPGNFYSVGQRLKALINSSKRL